MERKREFMSMQVWDTILRKYVVPYKEVNRFCNPTLIFHKDGESLLNRNFDAMLYQASSLVPDMNFDIYSHGLMLPKWKERGQDFVGILRSLPNKCRYLMSYHPFNHDGSVNDYTKTNEYMRNVLQNPPRNVEFIMVAHISRQASAETLNAWKETWRPEIERGVLTVHTNASINPWAGLIADQATCAYSGCPYADFGHLFIGVTGNIIACCLDLEEEIVFGNVMKDDPEEMFAKVAEFYANQAKVKSGELPLVHQVCANCMGQQRNDLIQVGGVA